MDAAAQLGGNPVSKHHIQLEYGDEQTDAGRDCRTRLARPNSHARTRTGKYYFSPVQLTTCRTGNLTRLIHTLAICVTIHTIHAGVPIATRIFLFVCLIPFCLFGYVAFSEYFFVPFPLSLCMESTAYVLSFRMVFFVFFYLVTTGWIFDISLCENSINSIKIKCFGEGGLQKVQTQGRKWCHDIEFEEKK